jgi:hypothetical protein
MTAGNDREPDQILSSATIDFAIRLGFIVLLGYWSFRVIAPFLSSVDAQPSRVRTPT